MKKFIWLIIVIVIVLALVFWCVGSYNSMVSLRESVDQSFGNVQTQYQRRADLIPNLLETVRGYSEYEESVLTAVTEARAGISSATTPSELSEAGTQLNDALTNINFVVEAYPDLKASETYISLMDELSGTENRINIARQDYNTAVAVYNRTIAVFPAKLVAGMFGFERSEYFEADAGASDAPQVSFN